MAVETYDLYGFYPPYVTKLAPLLIPAGRDPPFWFIKTVHNFYLLGEQIVMIHYDPEEEWTSFTQIEAESLRLFNEYCNPVRSRSPSLSASASRDERAEREEKPETVPQAIDFAERTESERKPETAPEVVGSLSAPLHPKLLAPSRVSATFASASRPDPNAGRTFTCEDP